MTPETYLARIGLDPGDVRTPDHGTLERLQRSHVTTVPFENLAITGDPFDDRDGDGVSLALTDLYQKIVERRLGGFCYELNTLFGWLLAKLGYELDRVAAAVLIDGEPRPPANHLAHVVSLDRRYVVDVGLGLPKMRRPLPLDGTVRTDQASVEWRVAESHRPDADYAIRFREAGDDDWTDRYVFRDVPRDLPYFEATCEYLQIAPESPFTGDPAVTVGTARGHKRLSREKFSRTEHDDTRERTVAPEEWHAVLEREFGVSYQWE